MNVFCLKNLVSGMESISSYGSRHLSLLDAVHVSSNKLVPALRSLPFWIPDGRLGIWRTQINNEAILVRMTGSDLDASTA